MALEISKLSATQLIAGLKQFNELLIDSVDGGASVGFLPPLSETDAGQYWRDVAGAIDSSQRVVLVAYEDGALQGSVQLIPELRANGDHRAEVVKLLVHSRARRRGLAKRLMAGIEQAAKERGTRLLLLDTRKDGEADHLYRRIGYQPYGEVPRYARSAKGKLEATVFFYREI